jgi:predicted ABC-type ATPase
MSADKVYTIFAGVNGAGKSTLYTFEDKDFGIRINFDEIVRDRFGHDWRNPKVQNKAGKIIVQLIKDCIDGDESFNQETTLTGKTILSNIKRAKRNGFKIDLYYVGLESVELSIERVAHRAAIGGHGIPEEVLRRRYDNSFENLKEILHLCDTVRIYDNSRYAKTGGMMLLLAVENGKIEVWNKDCPKYLREVLDDYIATI